MTLMQTEAGMAPQNSVLLNKVQSIKLALGNLAAAAQYDSSLVASARESWYCKEFLSSNTMGPGRGSPW